MTIADGFHFYLGRLLFGLAYVGVLPTGSVWSRSRSRSLGKKRDDMIDLLVAAAMALPNPKLTPGAVFPTEALTRLAEVELP